MPILNSTIKSEKSWQDLASYYANPWPYVDQGSLLLFVGFPSAKDPEAATRHPGKSTCVTRMGGECWANGVIFPESV